MFTVCGLAMSGAAVTAICSLHVQINKVAVVRKFALKWKYELDANTQLQCFLFFVQARTIMLFALIMLELIIYLMLKHQSAPHFNAICIAFVFINFETYVVKRQWNHRHPGTREQSHVKYGHM